MTGDIKDTDDKKALAEKILAWASVAYGFGFAVVLIHTARLGVPVLELVKPIYILIGLPLTALVFFSRQIVKSLRTAAVEHRNELVSVYKKPYISESDEQNTAVEKVVSSISKNTPWYIPNAFFTRALVSLLRERLSKGEPSQTMRFFDRLARLFRGYGALLGFLRLAYTVIGVGFLVFLYVWVIYPLIPMAYGGGAPTSVQLLLDVSRVPSDTSQLMGVRNASCESSALTTSLDLHYITSTAYLVELQTGSIVALDKEAVNGVIFPERPQAGDRQ